MSSKNFYKKITTVQIEHSSLCNAACPQCTREMRGGDYSWFKQTFIPTEFYEERIPQYIYDDLEIIYFCGTTGDPCMAPNFIEVCRIIKNKNPNIQLGISTNGGMRNPEWWSELGATLKENDYIIFGIDGLEDTNWIYRVGVKWNKLMENVKAFIAAGGKAHWQFIPFAHNEHQLEAAKELSKEMGFVAFFPLANNRFVSDELFEHPKRGADGKLLLPPGQTEVQHLLLKEKKAPLDYRKWVDNARNGCIECGAKNTNEAYIDVETHLVPCCFIGGATLTREPGQEGYDGYYDLWNEHGGDAIKLSKHTWEEIISGPFFNGIEESWNKDFGNGRLFVCSAICSNTESRINFYKNDRI
jgi:MoaA/NifB/PqqE/SkfB family radical SAM enzyme